MKVFQMREMREAIRFACEGGQAIHLHNINHGHPLFARYPQIAHLFDQNKSRLISTARKLGVRVIKVEYDGKEAQHIDLCGKPLERALCATEQRNEAEPAEQEAACEHELDTDEQGKFCIRCYERF